MDQQHKPRIKHLQGSTYLVESSSRPGLGHQVDVLRLRCGCEAGQHGRRCHHLVWAIQMDAWRRAHQVKAQQQSAAAKKAPTPATPFQETAAYKAFAECFA